MFTHSQDSIFIIKNISIHKVRANFSLYAFDTSFAHTYYRLSGSNAHDYWGSENNGSFSTIDSNIVYPDSASIHFLIEGFAKIYNFKLYKIN
jgi:hypothetical protein